MENEINLNLDENIIFYDFIKNIENNNKKFYDNKKQYNLNNININEFLNNNLIYEENFDDKNLNKYLLNKINLIQQINFEDKFIINFELIVKIFDHFDIFFQENYKLNNCKIEYSFFCIDYKIFNENELKIYCNLFDNNNNNELNNNLNILTNDLIKIFNNNQIEIIYLPIDEIINFCYKNDNNNNEKEIKNFIIKIKNFINELKKNINLILNSNELIFIKKIKFTISQDFIQNLKDFENIENFKSKFILFYYN